MSNTELAEKIRQQIVALAQKHSIAAVEFSDDDIIPENKVLDSLAIVELIVWIEKSFSLTLEQSEITVDNFGSINRIIEYVESH